MKNWQIAAGLAGLFLLMGSGMKLSKNFTLYELTRTDKPFPNSPGPKEVENLKRLAETILQPIRDRWGRIKISSGYRSLDVNRAVGSTLRSQHLTGEAADFQPLDAPIEQVFNWIKNESGFGYGQVIYEIKNGVKWIHISLPRPFKRNNEALLIIEGHTQYA